MSKEAPHCKVGLSVYVYNVNFRGITSLSEKAIMTMAVIKTFFFLTICLKENLDLFVWMSECTNMTPIQLKMADVV